MLKHRLGKLWRKQRLFAPLRPKRRLKLRFGVNQLAAHNHGIDCRRPIVVLEIEPEQLDPNQRLLLEQRLLGIDVCEGVLRADGSKGPACTYYRDTYLENQPTPCRIVAELPTLEALLQAVLEDDQRLEERRRPSQMPLAAM